MCPRLASSAFGQLPPHTTATPLLPQNHLCIFQPANSLSHMGCGLPLSTLLSLLPHLVTALTTAQASTVLAAATYSQLKATRLQLQLSSSRLCTAYVFWSDVYAASCSIIISSKRFDEKTGYSYWEELVKRESFSCIKNWETLLQWREIGLYMIMSWIVWKWNTSREDN